MFSTVVLYPLALTAELMGGCVIASAGGGGCKMYQDEDEKVIQICLEKRISDIH